MLGKLQEPSHCLFQAFLDLSREQAKDNFDLALDGNYGWKQSGRAIKILIPFIYDLISIFNLHNLTACIFSIS